MTPGAEIISTRYTKSVIKSCAALSYVEAQARMDDRCTHLMLMLMFMFMFCLLGSFLVISDSKASSPLKHLEPNTFSFGIRYADGPSLTTVSLHSELAEGNWCCLFQSILLFSPLSNRET